MSIVVYQPRSLSVLMHVNLACSAGKERPRKPDLDDLNAPPVKKVVREWAKMQSSKRFILQAEVEYWHEMLHINREFLSEQKESEMRFFLKKALRELNSLEEANNLAAA